MRKLIYNVMELLLGRADRLRLLLIRALLWMERKRPVEPSLNRLIEIDAFLDNLIDGQCVSWGDGVHIKHDIMTGIHSFFTERVPAGSRVLDVGCGIGALADAIAVCPDVTVTGIDFNPSQIEFAEAHFKRSNLVFMVGDATTDLPDGSIDVIVLSSVLEHVEDRSGLLRSLVAKYCPSKLLIRVPMLQRHYYVALKQRLGLFAYTDADHKTEYGEDQLRSELAAGGLAVDGFDTRWGDYWVECSVVGETHSDI
jgi:SAM-dependent methyltransferase